MKQMILPPKSNFKIALDLDDTIFDFIGAFTIRFPFVNWNDHGMVDELVYLIRKEKEFWENIPVLEVPDFTPTLYSTKRINSKIYTKNAIRKNNLPDVKINQIIDQSANKADKIRRLCHVLIDDSPFNVRQCLQSGFPALLITRPHNERENLPRVHSLKLDEIYECYEKYFT